MFVFTNHQPLYLLFAEGGTGEQLVGLREKFLSGFSVRKAYGGYAVEQAKKLQIMSQGTLESEKVRFRSKNATRVEKHGRHCVRLLLQGAELLSTGVLTVNVSEHKDFLFEAGECARTDPAGFQRLVQEKFAVLDEAWSRTVLPNAPDWGAVNDFVVATRLRTV